MSGEASIIGARGKVNGVLVSVWSQNVTSATAGAGARFRIGHCFSLAKLPCIDIENDKTNDQKLPLLLSNMPGLHRLS